MGYEVRKKSYVTGILIALNVITFLYLEIAGSSGAIFGVVGGLLTAVLKNNGKLEDLNIRQLAAMAALSLYLGFTENGVDNVAHIAGLLLGIIFGMILYRKSKNVDRRENYYEGF